MVTATSSPGGGPLIPWLEYPGDLPRKYCLLGVKRETRRGGRGNGETQGRGGLGTVKVGPVTHAGSRRRKEMQGGVSEEFKLRM